MDTTLFFHYFCGKRDNFCDFLLTNLYPNKSTGTPTGKEFAPSGANFFYEA